MACRGWGRIKDPMVFNVPLPCGCVAGAALPLPSSTAALHWSPGTGHHPVKSRGQRFSLEKPAICRLWSLHSRGPKWNIYRDSTVRKRIQSFYFQITRDWKTNNTIADIVKSLSRKMCPEVVNLSISCKARKVYSQLLVHKAKAC